MVFRLGNQFVAGVLAFFEDAFPLRLYVRASLLKTLGFELCGLFFGLGANLIGFLTRLRDELLTFGLGLFNDVVGLLLGRFDSFENLLSDRKSVV